MSYEPQYVELDGVWHLIGDGQRTECGIALPYDSPWTNELPKKVHCGPDADKAKKKD